MRDHNLSFFYEKKKSLIYHIIVLFINWSSEITCSFITKFIVPNTTARVYKTFSLFMLNSAEHEILNVHKYKNIKKVSFYQAQISLECYFSCS